jgi:ubiquinone/menaquinone biosynthesis C-methylase UbiE
MENTLISILRADGQPAGGPLAARLRSLAIGADVEERVSSRGYGEAHLEAITNAYARGYGRLVTMLDTHDPADIRALLSGLEQRPFVVGAPKKGTLAGTAAEAMLGLPRGASGAMRAYDLLRIPRELFTLVQEAHASFLEVLVILQQNGIDPLLVPLMGDGSELAAPSLASAWGLYVAQQTEPTRFRVTKSGAKLNPELKDPQNWNEYWDRKQRKTVAAYSLIATAYRNRMMRPYLEEAIKREFPRGANVLHAGCGTGHVDVGLHEHVRITAVDISTSALALYQRENPGVHRVVHGDLFALPFEDGSFDGAYNLGVVEHFTHDEITRMLAEVRRVVKPGGKIVVFWPHAYATSVIVLKGIHYVLNDVMQRDIRLHPPEISLVHSQAEARKLLESGGFRMSSYKFGPRDMFVQAVVVGERA